MPRASWWTAHRTTWASAFLAAPFERCAVMTLDGRGERATSTYGVYRDGHYQALGEVQVPHSPGLLYEQVTTHLGFLASSDEYKVMALAAQGRPRWLDALKSHVHLLDRGQYRIDPSTWPSWWGQALLEHTTLQLAGWLRGTTGERQLAMAGGVALNRVANARLRDAGLFDEVWV